MKLDFFIDRPVFSTVLSTVIVIVGIVGLVLLPVDQYPQIVPPVVKVSASYPGANAQTVTQAVATPIEQELNGTPGMIYMESSSSNSGSFSATVTFDISTDPDLAAVDIEQAETGRIASASRSGAERHFGGKAGIQQADDHYPALVRPEIRRDLPEQLRHTERIGHVAPDSGRGQRVERRQPLLRHADMGAAR